MQDALASFPYQQNLVQYVDDLLLASPDLESHVVHLKALLIALTEAGLKLNPDKAQLCRQRVSFLGVTITPSGWAIDQHKLSVILSLPLPTDITSLRSFLGMCNFMRPFVFNFSSICKPLSTLLRADHLFIWTEEHTTSVIALKHALTSTPVLSAPNYSTPFHLFIANSFSSLAAVLAQSDPAWYPLAFASRLTTPVEQKYTPCELTLLTAHWALQYFLFLTGIHKVIIHTSHHPLKYLFSSLIKSSTISSPHLSAMLLSLQHRDLEVSSTLPSLSFLPHAILSSCSKEDISPHICPLPLAVSLPDHSLLPSGLHPSLLTLYIDSSCFHKEGTVYTGFAVYCPIDNSSQAYRCEIHSAQYA
uniref:ribonuclease H n=1 Tax=Latimeria chalumnae TaxID=7897 RepID=H2ZRL4_LATCH